MGISNTKSAVDRACRIFSRARSAGRLAHAYLFSGTEKALRERLALDIAGFLLCDHPVPVDTPSRACGQCIQCEKIDRGVHPDLLLIHPEGGMIRLEQIRSLQAALAFSPLVAKRRVCIVFDAHGMNAEAANALLKTLEEPPDRSYLFLTADSVTGLLPTIVSRCQVVSCSQYSGEDAVKELERVGTCSADNIQMAIAMALGDTDTARRILNAGGQELRDAIVDFIGRRDAQVAKFFDLAQGLSTDRDRLLAAVAVIRGLVRDLLVIKGMGTGLRASFDPGQLLINKDLFEVLKGIGTGLAMEALGAYASWLDTIEWKLERNVNPQMLLETALVFWIRRRFKDSRGI